MWKVATDIQEVFRQPLVVETRINNGQNHYFKSWIPSVMHSLYHFFDDSGYICADTHFNHLYRFWLYHSTSRFYVKWHNSIIWYFKCTYKDNKTRMLHNMKLQIYTLLLHIWNFKHITQIFTSSTFPYWKGKWS